MMFPATSHEMAQPVAPVIVAPQAGKRYAALVRSAVHFPLHKAWSVGNSRSKPPDSVSTSGIERDKRSPMYLRNSSPSLRAEDTHNASACVESRLLIQG